MSYIWNKKNAVFHEVKPVYGTQRAFCGRRHFTDYSLYMPKKKRLCKECRRIKRERAKNR